MLAASGAICAMSIGSSSSLSDRSREPEAAAAAGAAAAPFFFCLDAAGASMPSMSLSSELRVMDFVAGAGRELAAEAVAGAARAGLSDETSASSSLLSLSTI